MIARARGEEERRNIEALVLNDANWAALDRSNAAHYECIRATDLFSL